LVMRFLTSAASYKLKISASYRVNQFLKEYKQQNGGRNEKEKKFFKPVDKNY